MEILTQIIMRRNGGSNSKIIISQWATILSHQGPSQSLSSKSTVRAKEMRAMLVKPLISTLLLIFSIADILHKDQSKTQASFSIS
jgi:hypothetical protein